MQVQSFYANKPEIDQLINQYGFDAIEQALGHSLGDSITGAVKVLESLNKSELKKLKSDLTA